MSIEPFNPSADAVYALVPDAERITDGNSTDIPTPTTVATVERWLTDLSAAVAVGIGPWGAVTGATGTEVRNAARVVVETGAASYLAAARYGNESSPYAAVLWERYTAGLAALKERVTAFLAPDAVDPDPAAQPTGPFGAFPAVYFGDGIQW